MRANGQEDVDIEVPEEKAAIAATAASSASKTPPPKATVKKPASINNRSKSLEETQEKPAPVSSRAKSYGDANTNASSRRGLKQKNQSGNGKPMGSSSERTTPSTRRTQDKAMMSLSERVTSTRRGDSSPSKPTVGKGHLNRVKSVDSNTSGVSSKSSPGVVSVVSPVQKAKGLRRNRTLDGPPSTTPTIASGNGTKMSSSSERSTPSRRRMQDKAMASSSERITSTIRINSSPQKPTIDKGHLNRVKSADSTPGAVAVASPIQKGKGLRRNRSLDGPPSSNKNTVVAASNAMSSNQRAANSKTAARVPRSQRASNNSSNSPATNGKALARAQTMDARTTPPRAAVVGAVRSRDNSPQNAKGLRRTRSLEEGQAIRARTEQAAKVQQQQTASPSAAKPLQKKTAQEKARSASNSPTPTTTQPGAIHSSGNDPKQLRGLRKNSSAARDGLTKSSPAAGAVQAQAPSQVPPNQAATAEPNGINVQRASLRRSKTADGADTALASRRNRRPLRRTMSNDGTAGMFGEPTTPPRRGQKRPTKANNHNTGKDIKVGVGVAGAVSAAMEDHANTKDGKTVVNPAMDYTKDTSQGGVAGAVSAVMEDAKTTYKEKRVQDLNPAIEYASNGSMQQPDPQEDAGPPAPAPFANNRTREQSAVQPAGAVSVPPPFPTQEQVSEPLSLASSGGGAPPTPQLQQQDPSAFLVEATLVPEGGQEGDADVEQAVDRSQLVEAKPLDRWEILKTRKVQCGIAFLCLAVIAIVVISISVGVTSSGSQGTTREFIVLNITDAPTVSPAPSQSPTISPAPTVAPTYPARSVTIGETTFWMTQYEYTDKRHYHQRCVDEFGDVTSADWDLHILPLTDNQVDELIDAVSIKSVANREDYYFVTVGGGSQYTTNGVNNVQQTFFVKHRDSPNTPFDYSFEAEHGALTLGSGNSFMGQVLCVEVPPPKTYPPLPPVQIGNKMYYVTSSEYTDKRLYSARCAANFGDSVTAGDWFHDIMPLTEDEVDTLTSALQIAPTFGEKQYIISYQGSQYNGEEGTLYFENHKGGDPPEDFPVLLQHHGLTLGAKWNYLGQVLCVENLDATPSPTMAPQAPVNTLSPLLTVPAVQLGGKTFRLTPEEYGYDRFFHQRCVDSFGDDHTAADWDYDIVQLSNTTGEVATLMEGVGIDPSYGESHTIVTYQTGQYYNGKGSDGQDVRMTLFMEYQPDVTLIPDDFAVLTSYEGLSLSAAVGFTGKVLCVARGDEEQ